MNFQIGDYRYLGLLLILPILVFVFFQYMRWVKKRREIFAEQRFRETLFEKSTIFSKVLPIIYIVALFFLIVSIVDIVNGGEKMKVKQKVNNVMFMLDVSNSMNAEDVASTRLNLAKNLLLNTISKMNHDRVGIVVFAGDAVSIMPLTTDYNAIENYVSGIETSTIKNQGTDFLKAMEVTVEKFKNITKGSRKVILISDGEDNEGNAEDALDLAKKEGLTIYSVGIGTSEGAPIPEYVFGQFMGYKTNRSGQPVMTQKQTEALTDLAKSTNGKYIDAQDVESTSSTIVKNINKGDAFSETTIDAKNTEHYYQYSLGISLFLFFAIYYFNPKRDFNL